jgi:SRSO17 transposase
MQFEGGETCLKSIHATKPRQYLGSVGKVDNGIVSVNGYGVYGNITFPLIVKIFKPKGTLKESDI